MKKAFATPSVTQRILRFASRTVISRLARLLHLQPTSPAQRGSEPGAPSKTPAIAFFGGTLCLMSLVHPTQGVSEAQHRPTASLMSVEACQALIRAALNGEVAPGLGFPAGAPAPSSCKTPAPEGEARSLR